MNLGRSDQEANKWQWREKIQGIIREEFLLGFTGVGWYGLAKAMRRWTILMPPAVCGASLSLRWAAGNTVYLRESRVPNITRRNVLWEDEDKKSFIYITYGGVQRKSSSLWKADHETINRWGKCRDEALWNYLGSYQNDRNYRQGGIYLSPDLKWSSHDTVPVPSYQRLWDFIWLLRLNISVSFGNYTIKK